MSRKVKHLNSANYIQHLKMKTGRTYVFTPYLQLINTSRYDTPSKSLYKIGLDYEYLDCGCTMEFTIHFSRELLDLQFANPVNVIKNLSGTILATETSTQFQFTPSNNSTIIIETTVNRQGLRYTSRLVIPTPLDSAKLGRVRKQVQLIEAFTI